MTKTEKIFIEIERLEKKGVDIHWLRNESTRLSNKMMQQYPNSWQKEVAKLYKYCAVVELIKKKRNEKKN